MNIGYTLVLYLAEGRSFKETGKNEKYENLEWSMSEKLSNGEYKCFSNRMNLKL